MKLVFPEGPLEYVGMAILGPIPKTKEGIQLLVVMTEKYKKLIRAVPVEKSSATTVARIILVHQVTNYSFPSKLLNDNGPQFVSKLFVAVGSTLGMIIITITE